MTRLPAPVSTRSPAPAVRSSRRRPGSACALEPLEPRRILSTSFAYAGVQYPATESSGYAIVYGIGVRDAGGAVTGMRNLINAAGQSSSGGIDISTMEFGPGGGMSLTDTAGIYTVAPFGADFRMSSGYPIGFFSVQPQQSAGDTGKLTRFFIEQRTRNLVWSNRYTLSVTQLTDHGLENTTATILFQFQHALDTPWPVSPPLSCDISFTGGGVFHRTVTNASADGTLTLDSGELLAFTNNSNPYQYDDVDGLSTFNTASDLLYIDPDASDGVVGVGVGSEAIATGAAGALGGVYRGSVIPASPLSAEFFGAESSLDHPLSADFVLTMSEDQSFNLYRAADYFTSQKPILRAGTWSLDYTGGTVFLVDSAGGQTANFRIGEARSLTAISVIAADHQSYAAVTGTLSQYVGTFEEKYGAAREVLLDPAGHPHVYSWLFDSSGSTTTEVWATFDLLARAGGNPLRTAQVITHPTNAFTTSPTNIARYRDMIAGIDTVGHAVVYERSYGGDWRYRDITAETGGPEITADSLDFRIWRRDAYFVEPAPYNLAVALPIHEVLVLAGQDAQDHWILYYPSIDYTVGQYDYYPKLAWNSGDITAHLQSLNDPSPDFSGGSVSGFTSPWGSINIVGLNGQGEVEALWTSPGSEWHVNNLSQAAGTTNAFVGALAPYWTTWYALNVSGLDAQGHINVLWWTPSTGQWIASDLTGSFGLAPLATQPPSGAPARLFTIINHDYSAMAIGGFDSRGHLVTYWWTVGQSDWQLRDITPSVPDADLPVSIDHGEYYPRTNLFLTDQSAWAINSEGDVVRSRWTDIHGDVWTYENITDRSLLQD